MDWRFELVPAPAPGSKLTGHVDWGDPVLRGWDWPFVAVRGHEPGPAVLVIAGVHGSEYSSIDAAIRLGAALDPATLKGQLLCLPLINPGAYWERTAYVSPVDNLNPNRTFPGKPKGSFSERLSHILTHKAVRRADAFIDLHGGDVPEGLVAFNIVFATGNAEVDAKSLAMAEAFGAPALLVQRDGETPATGQSYREASLAGIPALLAEDGGAGVLDPAASDRLLLGLDNVLRSLGSLPGPVRNTPAPTRYDRWIWLRAPAGGFFRPAIAVGDRLEPGQAVGTMVDFFGATVAEVAAPAAGRMLFMVVSPAIGPNGLIGGLAIE